MHLLIGLMLLVAATLAAYSGDFSETLAWFGCFFYFLSGWYSDSRASRLLREVTEDKRHIRALEHLTFNEDCDCAICVAHEDWRDKHNELSLSK